MTNFRPTTLSPEALKVWDEAEANIQASMQRIRELTAPLRHPKLPSLKEQATMALSGLISGLIEYTEDQSVNAATIRRALEQLDD